MSDTRSYIAKITVPSGTTYWIKDDSAWSAIGALQNAISAGFDVSVVTALPTASSATSGKIFLIGHAGHNPDSSGTVWYDYYDEYVTVYADNAYKWEKIGNTDINLDNYAPVSHVHSYSGETGDGGEHTHSIFSTKKYLVSQDDVPLTFKSKKFVTGLNTSNKLNTTSITPVDGEVKVTNVTLGTAKNFAEASTNDVSLTYATVASASVTINPSTTSFVKEVNTGSSVTTAASNTVLWDAAVNNETLTLTMKSFTSNNGLNSDTSASTTANTTTIVNQRTTKLVTGTVSMKPITADADVSVAQKGTSTTVATGLVSVSGTGSAVATGISSSDNAYYDVSSTASLIKNATPGDTVTNVRVITDASLTDSAGKHAHSYSGTTLSAK